MGVVGFLACFALGSGILALWIDNRAPRLAPTSLRGILIHVGASVVVANVVVHVAMERIIDNSPGSVLLAVFALALPATTYSLLAAVWLIKLLAAIARGLPH